MPAITQPRIVKVSVPAVPSEGRQWNHPARVAPKSSVGRRFLEFLMLALAAPHD